MIRIYIIVRSKFLEVDNMHFQNIKWTDRVIRLLGNE